MKTAMQELIDLLETQRRLFIESERHTLADGIGRTILLSKQFLEKEKEQILRAFELGMHECLAYDANSIKYYNQTYKQEETLEEWKSKFTHHCAIKDNQKQHIVDIMKADEDDGLYNQNNKHNGTTTNLRNNKRTKGRVYPPIN